MVRLWKRLWWDSVHFAILSCRRFCSWFLITCLSGWQRSQGSSVPPIRALWGLDQIRPWVVQFHHFCLGVPVGNPYSATRFKGRKGASPVAVVVVPLLSGFLLAVSLSHAVTVRNSWGKTLLIYIFFFVYNNLCILHRIHSSNMKWTQKKNNKKNNDNRKIR